LKYEDDILSLVH